MKEKTSGRRKAIVFDSSSIISLAMNGLLHVLEDLKKTFDGEFLITPQVKAEVVDHPLEIKRFELEALMILDAIKKGTMEVRESPNLANDTEKIRVSVNSIFVTNKEKMKIFHVGESSCIALCNYLEKQGYEVLFSVDERTARMLIENPENLRKLFELKLHTKMDMKKINLDFLKNIDVIRSAELCLAAYRKGMISLPASKVQAIDAILYGLKYNGCSISFNEIEDAKSLF